MNRNDEGEPPRAIQRQTEIVAYKNNFATIFDDEVTFADGSPGRHLRIATAGSGPGVVLLPVHQGTIGLVQTYRYPLGAWQWALPRGFSHAVDPIDTARAELREELGLTAASLRLIGEFSPDSGLLAKKVAVVLAEIEEVDGGPEDVVEVRSSRWLPLATLWDEVATGNIDDGMTLAALALANAAGKLGQH
jgi:8-oxo-dGTP pyrophosphatase MutT (NUDIX family)